MAIELITGYAGEPHISSDDVGEFYAGLIGTGYYILPVGNKCAASLTSNNTVQINTGSLVMSGRHVRISAIESVTIASGSSAYKRNDLICVAYKRNAADSKEKASLEVVQGTPTTGTPADPTVPAGSILAGDAQEYMPLYRVTLTGTSLGEPVALVKEASTLGSLAQADAQITQLQEKATALQTLCDQLQTRCNQLDQRASTIDSKYQALNPRNKRIYSGSSVSDFWMAGYLRIMTGGEWTSIIGRAPRQDDVCIVSVGDNNIYVGFATAFFWTQYSEWWVKLERQGGTHRINWIYFAN